MSVEEKYAQWLRQYSAPTANTINTKHNIKRPSYHHSGLEIERLKREIENLKKERKTLQEGLSTMINEYEKLAEKYAKLTARKERKKDFDVQVYETGMKIKGSVKTIYDKFINWLKS